MDGTAIEAGDAATVIDTFTAIEYDNTFVYLSGDRTTFCVPRGLSVFKTHKPCG